MENAVERAKKLNSGKEVDKEELVTMSKDELKQLMTDTMEEYKKEIESAKDEIERLKKTYERDEDIRYLKNRGQFADENLEVRQLGPLGPIDHQQVAIDNAGVRDKLKGKKARFVSTNSELNSLRRAQGYEPVLDKDGNEVRYMDGVLMAMPEKRWEEEIAKPTKVRRDIHRRAIRENFEETGRKHGVETYGEGIQFDEGEPG